MGLAHIQAPRWLCSHCTHSLVHTWCWRQPGVDEAEFAATGPNNSFKPNTHRGGNLPRQRASLLLPPRCVSA